MPTRAYYEKERGERGRVHCSFRWSGSMRKKRATQSMCATKLPYLYLDCVIKMRMVRTSSAMTRAFSVDSGKHFCLPARWQLTDVNARNACAPTDANSDWIKPHPHYLQIARSVTARLSGYRALFNAVIGKSELAQIRDCTHKGWALGGDKFKQEIEARTQRQASLKGVGRPRVAEANDRQ